MLSSFRNAGLIWPTVFATVGFVVLVALGNWQWARMQWRDGLNARIEARAAKAAVPLTSQLIFDPDAEYTRVTFRGRYLHDQERHLYAANQSGRAGWNIITPLVRAAPADGASVVLVNRGWIPFELKAEMDRSVRRTAGEVSGTGLLRRPEVPGYFAQPNAPDQNTWYWRDHTAMLRCAPGTDGAQSCAILKAGTGVNAAGAVPSMIAVEANDGADTWPRPGTTVLKSRNRHLGYALTWWGLAATLVGVYLAFAWQRLSGRDAMQSGDDGQ